MDKQFYENLFRLQAKMQNALKNRCPRTAAARQRDIDKLKKEYGYKD